ncbi:ATP-binding protein [Labilibaculum sp. K2S]|uniref:ATP-binding protein n=1 Tax=Labilibaculum sp. K2S TaxID=3056386 RepID=UPI0025A39B14|nr:ATP-binding protein [Labilibaculum sp. K2S]MDM8160214.1 ATP-binding protein [Labilibaculum sp. K2S]
MIISVSDNGVGLKKRIWINCFGLNTAIQLGTNKEKGTGLGLLLCKEFIEMHGCEIWADGNQEKGCTFNFTIPLN